MSIRERLIKGTVSMLALRILSVVLVLILNACLSRWMSPEEFASYLAGMTLLLLVSMVSMAGLPQSMLRLISGRKDQSQSHRVLLWRCWGAALVSSVMVTAVFVALLRTQVRSWLEIDPAIVASLCICSFLISIHKLLAASLRSVHAIASSGILEGRAGGPLTNLTYFPILAIFGISGLTAARSFHAFAVALAVTLPFGVWMLIRALAAAEAEAESGDNVSEYKQGAESTNILLFSLPFLIAQLLTHFSSEFSVLMAQAHTSPEDTALFGSARRLIMQMLTFMQILAASAGSTIAELYARGQHENLRKTLRYSATVSCVVTLPLLAVCLIFPGLILGTVYSDFYRGGAVVFSIMAVGQIVRCLTGQCVNLLLLSGHTKPLLIVRIIGAATMVLAGTFAVKAHGITGLAVVVTVIVMLQSIALWLIARVQTGFWTHPTFRNLGPIIRHLRQQARQRRNAV